MKILITLSALLLSAVHLFGETYYYAFGQKVILKPLPQTRSAADQNIHYFQTKTGTKLGVKNEIIIGCKDMEQCKPVLENYPVTSVEKRSDTLYLLTLKKGSDPFKVANSLSHEEPIFLSHPNFIIRRIAR